MTENKYDVSIVVPMYDEAENVEPLHKEIIETLTKLGKSFEIIFVIDGLKSASDKTLEKAKHLSPLKIVLLRKNSGQTSAMNAGFNAARGDVIITMDGDLQNDPADIPKLLDALENENLDVVSGWRKNRKDPFSKRFVSRGANLLRKFFVNDKIHDSGCTLKAYKRVCFETVNLYGEMHRFIPAILRWKGFQIGEIVVNHRPRIHGKSKYSVGRIFKGLLDMINIWFWRKFLHRPLHLFGGLGIMMILGSFVCVGIAGYLKIFYHTDLTDTALTFLGMTSFLAGIQLFVLGLLADVIGRNYFETTKDSAYLVKEVIVQD